MKKSIFLRLAIVLGILMSLGLVPAVAQECDSEVIEIEFMNWWDAAREALMDEVIANFESENPCVKIINQIQPWDNRSELLSTAAASSTPPDLIMSTRPETYQFAMQGLITPFDAFVDASGLDLGVFYDGEIGIQYWNGELYGLPMPTAGGATGMFFYNKQLLAEAGFDPESPPQTWQELQEMSAAMTQGDAIGLDVMGAGIAEGNLDEAFVAWLYTNNGQYSSEDGRTLMFNSAEGIETLEWMLGFVNDVNLGIENVIDFNQDVSFPEGDHPFYDDQLGFMSINVSAFGHLNSNAPEMFEDTSEWGVMLRPYNGDNPDAESAGVTGYGLSGGWAYTIPSVHPPEVQEAAYAFAEYLGVNELGGCAFLFAQSRPSPIRTCNENEAYYDANPYWATVLDGLAIDVPIAITPVQGQIAEILRNNIEEAFFGIKTAEEALNDAQAEGQALLDEFWSEIDA